MSEKCGSHEALSVKIENLEEKSESHNKRIGKLEEKQGDVIELKTLMKMVVETTKEQSQTLANINENLNRLNKGYENLDRRMETVEANQKDIKTNSSIDLVKLGRDIVFKVVPAIILTWLLIQFGLK